MSPLLASTAADSYVWDLRNDRWTWSPGLYELHGLAPSITPTTELLLACKHDDDRQRTIDVIAKARIAGGAFCCDHRIVRVDDGSVRRVVAIGAVERDAAGEPTTVRGRLIDITGGTARLSWLSEVRERPQPRAAFDLDAPGLRSYWSSPGVLHLAGEVDLGSRRSFGGLLDSAIERGGDLVLGVRDLAFLDAAGAMTVFEHARHLDDAGLRVILLDPARLVDRLLDVLGRPGNVASARSA